MTCNICVNYNASKNSARPSSDQNFISGSRNFKKSTVTDHELSRIHIRSVELFKAETSSSDEIAFSKAGRALQKLKSADKTKMTFLFRNAHAVAVKNRPLSDFKWLCELDKVKSLEVGDTYLNDRAALNFIQAIAATQHDEVINNLEHAPFFSFIMDGSTDISGDEQESMYVRSCHKGVVTENFLNIGSPRSTCSSDLYFYVTNILESTGLHSFAKDKLVGMGSDGASNMIGSKTGLATRLKEDFPEMVSVHCLCHRLELAFRDVFRKAALYDKCMTLLIGLHYFYLKPKQKTGLVHTMKSLGINGLLPPKVTGTRWLPHLSRGLTAFFRSYPALEAHLSTASHGNAKAEGLAKMVLDRHLVAFTLFLQNLLVPLQKLSLQLQRNNATLSDVLLWTEATTEMLQDCKESQCKDLHKVLEQGTYQDVKLKGSCPAMTYKSVLVDKTMKAIEERFAMQHSESADIFAATKIACLRSWPSVEDSQEFGDSDICVIFRQFSNTLTKAGITKDVVDQEWRLMKKILYKRSGLIFTDSMQSSFLNSWS
ncbi:zinc finger protein 862-like [Haliotis rubra]|uniref:zinc finger protein 862-like n=1 Tax=Haliotis rubra TaxID=36100 RepID=UPI001EE62A42|nr:zinc finger protein 862-like [Haliotis rubra]